MAGREAGTSYTDYGLVLERSIEDMLIQMEKEGWRVHCLRGTRLRYWCSCQRQHQVWVDTDAVMVDERIDFLFNKTCISFNN